MKRGPKAGSRPGALLFTDKVATRWSPIPEWVLALAQAADTHGLAEAGRLIDYSGSLVSSVLSGTYRGDLQRVAEKVAGALMGAQVDCPRLGEMTRNVCLDWQGKPFAATSSLRVEMFRACRGGCPHSKITKGQSDADA